MCAPASEIAHDVGIGVVFDDDLRERIDATHAVRGVSTELVVRRKDDRPAAPRDQRAFENGVGGVVRTDAPLGGYRARTKHAQVDVEPRDRLERRSIDRAADQPVDHPADHQQIDGIAMLDRGGDRDRARGNGKIELWRQPLNKREIGTAIVDENETARFHEPKRGVGQHLLALHVLADACHHRRRPLDDRQGAAIDAATQALRRQTAQIAPDRILGNAELLGKRTSMNRFAQG